MIGYIYMWTAPNNKSYIGQTNRLPHIRAGENGKNYGLPGTTPFNSSIKSYGFDNFVLTVLHEVNSLDKKDLSKILNKLEKQEIKQNNTLFPNGYNLQPGGDSKLMHEITKLKIGATLRKANRHTVHSDETKEKIRQTLLGKKHTEQRRKNISKATKGRKALNKGMKTLLTEERRKLQSNIGKKSLHEKWHVNRGIVNNDCILC